MSRIVLPRRQFLKQSGLIAGSLSLGGLPAILRAGQAPALITAEASRPATSWGLQIGDVCGSRAVVWSRTDRPSRMRVEWALDDSFNHAREIRGPHALEISDFTARVDLTALPPDRQVFLRVTFESLEDASAVSEVVTGRFRTPPAAGRDLRFVWGGDTAGQGWGIDLSQGGMRIYETMRARQPDFFLHSGDTVYADGPMQPQVDTGQWGTWTNAYLDLVPEKTKVAETLREYHRNYLYNLFDENVRRFNAEVPQIWQWDDHETANNWSPGKDLSGNAAYTEKSVFALVGNSTRAFLDYAPMRWHDVSESERIYRKIPYGEDLDVFVLDMRSYRAANGPNQQTAPGPDTVYLGETQIRWLKTQLRASRATWKVIAADMPIGLVVADGTNANGQTRYENSSNGDGPVLGREFEIADILSFIKHAGIENTVWLTADVHYCAAHYYSPDKAQYKDFSPFWEFVAGPLSSGTFGPNPLDDTFGPTVVFQRVPPAGQANLPPSAGYQFFGQVDIDSRAKTLTVSLVDIAGTTLYTQMLSPRHR